MIVGANIIARLTFSALVIPFFPGITAADVTVPPPLQQVSRCAETETEAVDVAGAGDEVWVDTGPCAWTVTAMLSNPTILSDWPMLSSFNDKDEPIHWDSKTLESKLISILVHTVGQP